MEANGFSKMWHQHAIYDTSCLPVCSKEAGRMNKKVYLGTIILLYRARVRKRNGTRVDRWRVVRSKNKKR